MILDTVSKKRNKINPNRHSLCNYVSLKHLLTNIRNSVVIFVTFFEHKKPTKKYDTAQLALRAAFTFKAMVSYFVSLSLFFLNTLNARVILHYRCLTIPLKVNAAQRACWLGTGLREWLEPVTYTTKTLPMLFPIGLYDFNTNNGDAIRCF